MINVNKTELDHIQRRRLLSSESAEKITDDIAKYFGDIEEAFEICEVCFMSYYMAVIAVIDSV